MLSRIQSNADATASADLMRVGEVELNFSPAPHQGANHACRGFQQEKGHHGRAERVTVEKNDARA